MATVEPGRRRRALLVIHGIGDQPPLRTLGAFVEGLTRAAATAPAAAAGDDGGQQPTAEVVELAGKSRPLVRLPAGALGGADEFDVIEYHWAEHAVGRMSAVQSFGWLLEVALAGLDFRRQLPFLLAGLEPRRAWPLVLRQLAQVASLAGLAVALVVATLLVGARAGEALAAVRSAAAQLPGFPPYPELAALTLLACLLAAVTVLARDLVLAQAEARAVSRRHVAASGWSGMHGPAARRWLPPGLLVLASTLGAAALLAYLLRATLAGYATAIGTLLAEPGVTVGLLALLAGTVARELLLSHVSDIALYVTSDRLSSRARTRRAILDEGEAVLRGLLEAGYDGVYLAGHSLGSVVALDLLDRLARGAGSDEADELERVRGLLTFGSPLDKVAFFFRQRPHEGEAVRSQLLSFLHGVRRRHDLRDYGPYAFAPYRLPFERLDWLQVHAPGDLLSDRLIHYRVDRRVVLPRFNPFTAHNAYWRDDRFYAAALGWLRGEGMGVAATLEGPAEPDGAPVGPAPG